MSHFTVLVIGDDPEIQLEPFQENNMGDCPREYMEFEDHENELKEEYETNYSPKDSKSLHFTKRGKPWKLVYPKFEDFVEQWHSYSSRDSAVGKYGNWYNPNAQWDWYRMGGRWRGYMIPPPGKKKNGILGSPGCGGNKPMFKNGVDSALVKHIDIDDLMERPTHSVLNEGTWIEQGQMGWFGCVKNSKDETVWLREYQKLLRSLPPNTRVSIYDCHI